MFDTTAAAYALLLGAIAAFNPCGFALLPAYLTVIMTGSADGGVTRGVALRRAVGFALAMSLGFLVVFAAFGVLFGAINLGLQASVLPAISYVTIVLGALVMGLGVVVVVRGELAGPGLRIKGHAPRAAFWSQAAYGASFALASLSCTIGLFLVVVTQAIDAASPADAVVPFLAYAGGMGASVVIVSVLAALVGTTAAAALRRRTPVLMRAGGVLMVLAGLFVLVYGLAEVLPRHGIRVLDDFLRTTSRWQGDVAAAIQGWGTPVLVILVVVAASVVIATLVPRRRG